MLKAIEMQGRTEDEAIELALEKLGLSRDDVSVEILETAKSGLFGRKTPAIVKVEFESDDVTADVSEFEFKPKDAAKSSDADSGRKSKGDGSGDAGSGQKPKDIAKASDAAATPKRKAPSRQPAVVDSELTVKIDSYLNGLFEHMGLEVGIEIAEGDDSVNVTLTADDPGVLIGRRGETLDALQLLTNYSINRSVAGRVRIYLDAENYRVRRSESLESLALRTASKVVKYRRNLTLDPMNAYERHIVHTALQGHAHVSTFSVGNDATRRVVIAYGQSKEARERPDSPRYKEWS